MMRWTRFAAVAALAALALGCGGEKPQAADSAAQAQPTLQPAPNPSDTVKPAATTDSVKPKADSTGAKKASGPLRDSAFGPKFSVDSAGKVTPIKKP